MDEWDDDRTSSVAVDDGRDWGEPFDLSDLDERPRRWGLVVAAVLPWVAIAWLLLGGRDGPVVVPAPDDVPGVDDGSTLGGDTPAGDDGAPDGDVRDGPSTDGAAVEAGPEADDAQAAGARAAADDADGTVGDRTLAPVEPAAVAVGGAAEVAVADWAGTRDRFVVHTVVLGIEVPATGAAVVRVAATTAAEDGTTAREELGVGVLLHDDGVTATGEVWPLPRRRAEPPPGPTSVDDPDLGASALDALLASGLDVAAVDGLARHGGGPLVATWTDTAEQQHTAWLTAVDGELHLAGADR